MASSNNYPLFVLYGSATGNAEHIAKDLASSITQSIQSDKASIPFDSVICCEADKYKKLCEPIWNAAPTSGASCYYGVVVVTSTTGNGDAPENISRFVRYLKRKTTPATAFQHVAYTVLGLGDTNYDQFCQCGVEVDKLLHKLGGTRIQPLVKADEATGLEDTVEPWKDTVLEKLIQTCCPQSNACNGGAAATATPESAEEKEKDNGNTTMDPPKTSETRTVTPTPPTVASTNTRTTQEVSVSVPSSSASSSSAPGLSILRSLLREYDNDKNTSTKSNGTSVNIPSIDDPKVLPSLLSTAMSSCTLLNDCVIEQEQNDNNTGEYNHGRRGRAESIASTVSSGAPYYSIRRPYHARILSARYLTRQTHLTAAQRIVSGGTSSSNKDDNNATSIYTNPESLSKAMKVVEETFPLDKDKDNAKVQEMNGKRVLEVTLQIPDDESLLQYEPGDALGVIVENAIDDVRDIVHMLQTYHSTSPTQLVKMMSSSSTEGGDQDNNNNNDDAAKTMTVEDTVRTRIDLSSRPVSKRLLYALSQCFENGEEEANGSRSNNNNEERAALRLLASKTPTGTALYDAYIAKQRISFVDLVVREFPSLGQRYMDLPTMLAVLPSTIAPRYYSVSSSPLSPTTASPTKHLTIAFSIVDYVTPSLQVANQEVGRRRIGGVATRLLEVLSSHQLAAAAAAAAAATGKMTDASLPLTIPIFPKPTVDFRLPKSLKLPLILIGPGTGVAPFMGFLQHRKQLILQQQMAQKQAEQTVVDGTWRGGYDVNESELLTTNGNGNATSNGGNSISDIAGSVDLFFGCRHKDHDWLYREEMELLQKEGIITKLYTAFSRDQDSNKSNGGTNLPRYVQHILLQDEECANRFVDLILNQDARVYVCGDGNAMAKDVQSAIVELLSKRHYNNDTNQAQSYLDKMKTTGRFLLDIWS